MYHINMWFLWVFEASTSSPPQKIQKIKKNKLQDSFLKNTMQKKESDVANKLQIQCLKVQTFLGVTTLGTGVLKEQV